MYAVWCFKLTPQRPSFMDDSAVNSEPTVRLPL